MTMLITNVRMALVREQPQASKAAYAASTPNTCIAPCFNAQGTWKKATLNPERKSLVRFFI